ncbi:MAG: 30S ribosomal protein S1 [Acidobacteriota bacterium]|nr:30S ribosomal protein S1 [Acidobacteriota bacterium]
MSAEENSAAVGPGLSAAQANAGVEPVESAEAGDMFAGLQEMPEVTEGKIIRGRVLNITDSEVFVDIGQKSEGSIPREEFLRADGSLSIQSGDPVDVEIVSYDENNDTFTLSHKKAAHQKAWEDAENAFNIQATILGRVVERTKGGLIVDLGVRAFLPGSQADIRPLRNLDSLVGQEICCKVVKLNKGRNNLVVSRKAALEEELNQKKSQLLATLAEGAVINGRVKNVTEYGAFVDLGGLDGLLHITDIAWGRIARASDALEVGQEVRVKVLKYDAEKGRVSLGMKQLAPDPWEGVENKYSPGQSLNGRVVSVTDYGAFVELEPGVEGLVHVSEMAWSRRLKHPSKIVKVGDPVEVRVIEVHGAKRRISLSLKQTLPDPWTTIGEHYQLGQTVEGRVRNLTDFGAFVEIEDGVDALIHVSDLSWSKNIKHPSEVLKKGQKVQGQILSLDPARRRISLGLKQLRPDVWEGFFSKAEIGMPVRGKVVRIAQFGAFVEVEEGIEALCHNSELDADHTASGPAALEVGNEYEFWVVRLDPGEKRIGLSMKTAKKSGDEAKPAPVAAAAAAATPPKPEAPQAATGAES